MKIALLFLLLLTSAHAEFSDDQFPQSPGILSRIIAAAQAYGDPLSSRSEDKMAYYLRSAEYIGSCEAPFGRVHAARLFYIHSAPQSTKLPARGHTYIVFLDASLHVRGNWEVDAGSGHFSFKGTKFCLDNTVLFDYAHLPERAGVVMDGQPVSIPRWKSQ
jgi:hypothetical protein